MTCWKENCKTCKEVWGWEYIWGVTFKEFLSIVRWSTIVFILLCIGIGYLVFGWIGVILGYFFAYMMCQAQDGAVADLWGEFPPNEEIRHHPRCKELKTHILCRYK